jgi:hypothetical protein
VFVDREAASRRRFRSILDHEYSRTLRRVGDMSIRIRYRRQRRCNLEGAAVVTRTVSYGSYKYHQRAGNIHVGFLVMRRWLDCLTHCGCMGLRSQPMTAASGNSSAKSIAHMPVPGNPACRVSQAVQPNTWHRDTFEYRNSHIASKRESQKKMKGSWCIVEQVLPVPRSNARFNFLSIGAKCRAPPN